MRSFQRVLVTGGAGFIGAALVQHLVDCGYQVRSFDNGWRSGHDRLRALPGKIEVVQGDIRDPQQVRDACQGMDAVLHLAAINGTRYFYERPDLVLEVGVKGTLHVMDEALRAGVKRLVVASSAEAYQQPTHVPTTESERLIVPDVTNPRYSYGGSKLIDELLALHYAVPRGLETVVFRPHNIYGPDMGFEHVIPQLTMRLRQLTGDLRARNAELPLAGRGDETRSYCYIDDCTRAIVLCLEKGESGSVYHIGEDREEVSANDLAIKIGQAAGVTVTPKPGKPIPGQTTRRLPSIERIRALGYASQVSLEQGLAKAVSWYRTAPLVAEDWTDYLDLAKK